MDYTNIKLDNNIKLNDNIINFLDPKYIFLPINRGYKLKVKDGNYVYKNDIVMLSNLDKCIHTSVSGKVLGVKDMLYSNGLVPSLVIENDFKENVRYRRGFKKYISDYSKRNFIECLDDNPVYDGKNLVLDKLNNITDTLVINAVELEPYFGNKYFYIKDNADDILETIDLISDLFEFKNTYIVLKNTDTKLINEFLNFKGTYPNIEIKLINNIYPNGMNKLIDKNFNIKGTYLGVNSIFDIYEVLKKKSPITSRLITITGNAINPKSVVRVKIGSLLSEVFMNNFDFIEKYADVYLNGIMTGKRVDSLKYVIDNNIDGIVINKKIDKPIMPCSSCGLCYKCCPVKIDPKYVLDKKGNVKDEYKNRCIRCGLCNYVCPSNINLMALMENNNEEVK